MQFIYTLLLTLITPLIFIRSQIKLNKSQHFLKFPQKGRWQERLAIYSHKDLSTKTQQVSPIWIHTVSVGEFIAVKPLINDLLTDNKSISLLLTCTTLTGSDQILSEYAKHEQVEHVYLPWDLPYLMRRFYQQFQPKIGLVLETEVWPNLLKQANKVDCPIWLINARLSEKSAKGYQRFKRFSQKVFNRFERICVQNKVDGDRIIDLGFDSTKLIVTGSIKFDLVIDEDKLRQSDLQRKVLAWQNKFVITASSTHEGEDELILDSFKQLKQSYPNSVLIIVPRHPERFTLIEQLIQKNYSQYSLMLRSQLGKNEQLISPDILLGDSMGEMMQYYYISNLVIMGGSFIPRGGHNLLEPAALAKPIILGPHMFNFTQIVKLFLARHAVIQLDQVENLNSELLSCWADKKKIANLSSQAKLLMQEHSGVKNRLLLMLKDKRFI